VGEGKSEGLGAVPTVTSTGKAHGGSAGALPPKTDDTFCENMLFCHGFKNHIAIFAFIACKCSIQNGRKFGLEAEKW